MYYTLCISSVNASQREFTVYQSRGGEERRRVSGEKEELFSGGFMVCFMTVGGQNVG